MVAFKCYNAAVHRLDWVWLMACYGLCTVEVTNKVWLIFLQGS